jgi:hypothetical protein
MLIRSFLILLLCLGASGYSHNASSTDMDFTTFRLKARQLAQAASRASALDSEDLLLSSKDPIYEVLDWITPDCDVRAFAADKELFSDLAQVAMLAVKAITARGSSLHLDALQTLQPLAMGLQNAKFISMDYGTPPLPTLPSGLFACTCCAGQSADRTVFEPCAWKPWTSRSAADLQSLKCRVFLHVSSFIASCLLWPPPKSLCACPPFPPACLPTQT